MKRLILGIIALGVGWLWSRGARDPREWPERIPQEFAALSADIKDALAAGKRAGTAEEEAFEQRFSEPHIPTR